jgi:hypothetical protein
MVRVTQQRILSTTYRLTTALTAAIALAALTIPMARAQTLTVLHGFGGESGADGSQPFAGVAESTAPRIMAAATGTASSTVWFVRARDGSCHPSTALGR